MRRLTLSIIFFLTYLNSFSQNTNISGIINSYQEVLNISSNTFTVNSTSDFSSGDLVLIIQMKGGEINETNTSSFGDITNYYNAGNYEYSRVCEITNITELKVSNLKRAYDITGAVQLIKVPEYVNATVTSKLEAKPWDGLTGGVLIFSCDKTLEINANINLEGHGFRGGEVTTSSYNCTWVTDIDDYYYSITSGKGAKKGEGIAAYITGKSGGAGAQSNGGGGGNDHNSGGGGGANAGSGGQGGERIRPSSFTCAGPTPGRGGKLSVFNNTTNKIFLGGGGGSGHENNLNTATAGTNGGGIVIIKANTLIGNGNIINVNGTSIATNSIDGAGGGGAGGSVLLDIKSYTGSLTIMAEGASGGNVSNVGPSNCNGPGGGGGGGLIWVNQSTIPGNIGYSVSGGGPGITLSTSQPNCSVGSANNANNGTSGSALTNLNLAQPTCSLPPLTETLTICHSDSVWLSGTWQNKPGKYKDTISGICCDTILITTLTIHEKNDSDTTIWFCFGDSVLVHSIWSSAIGEYSDTLKSENGCDSISIVNLMQTTLDTAVIHDQLTITSLDQNANYQWIDCQEQKPIINATNQIFTPTVNGIYAVELKQNNCVDTSRCIHITTIGVLEFDSQNIVSIYPNPTSGEFSLDLGENYKHIKIDIYNSIGQKTKSLTKRNSRIININIEGIPGYYLADITLNKKIKTSKLILKIEE